MDLSQLSKKIIHIDLVELFRKVKSKEEFYIIKDQLYNLLIERVFSYALQYGKCKNISFNEKDKDELYILVADGKIDIRSLLYSYYNLITVEQAMAINDFITFGFSYVDKYIHEVIKRMKNDDHVYFSLTVVGSGVMSISYFTHKL